jgi:hypothetical protein
MESTYRNGILDAEYSTPQQLAKELEVCVHTLDRWERIGTGPARTRVGRRTLYRRATVLEWLKGLEKMPGKSAQQRESATR